MPLGLDVMLTIKSGDMVWHEADASVVDLSQGGLLVCCDRVPRSASRVILRFEWHGYGACVGYGALARVAEVGGFAARFDRVNWAMQDFLGLYAVLGESQRGQLLAQLSRAQITIE